MVNTSVIDCEMLLDRDEAHRYLAQALALPGHYGANLDALYDCITEMGPRVIVLRGAEVLRQWGGYGAKILSAIEDAVQSNPNLSLEYDDEVYEDDDPEL